MSMTVKWAMFDDGSVCKYVSEMEEVSRVGEGSTKYLEDWRE
jgi:hypothetical protein